MKRNAFPPLHRNPLLLWADIGLKTTEMMIASAHVIAHRTKRLRTAGLTPGARDRREFTLMAQEKVEAATESAGAIAAQMLALNPFLGPRAMQQMFAGTAAMMRLAASRTPAQFTARQMDLARTMARSAG